MNRLSQHMPEISQSGSKPRSEENRCSPSQASQAAEVLFGCYRTGGAAEPEIFVAGVAAVLSDYPAEVVQRVVDPRDGLPSRTNWLPTIAEVKAACEREMAPIRRQRDRERREAESARLLAAPPAPKPTMDEIREKLGPTYGIERGTKEPVKTEGELLDLAKSKVEVSNALAESNREFMERRGWNQLAASEGEND